jgi:hypothetical protein
VITGQQIRAARELPAPTSVTCVDGSFRRALPISSGSKSSMLSTRGITGSLAIRSALHYGKKAGKVVPRKPHETLAQELLQELVREEKGRKAPRSDQDSYARAQRN